MMDDDENERFTRVSKGTPMGELLRRYWHPIAAVTELDDEPIKPVRLMGEDLVVYRDRSGTYGIVERHCPHRRADLAYGFVEDRGIRCSYHGWAYDEAGRCIAQPYEDLVNASTRFRDSIRLTAYRVEECAGLLFAYLGPDPAPQCPFWELFGYEDGFRQIVFAPVECNWLQCAENNIDPVHFEWLHSNWSIVRGGRAGPYSPRHVKVDFIEWEFGFGYRRILENTDETGPLWAQPRLAILPNLFMPGGSHFEYRVPVDDLHTLSVVWDYEPVPLEQRPYVQGPIPYWYADVCDPVTGRYLTSHVINQDTVAWVGQGAVADRSQEHLAKSDRGVIMLRRQLARDMDAVARGDDPKGLVRNRPPGAVIRWPDDRRDDITRGLPKSEWLERRAAPTTLRPAKDYFLFYAGQPERVRRAYEEAMGIDAGVPTDD